MDPWTVLIVVLVIVLVARLFSTMKRQRAVAEGAAPRRSAKDGLAKIEYLIDHCRGSLHPDKLRKGNDAYTFYYIGYLHEVARFIADDEGVPFSTAFQTPILLEAIRLCDARSAASSGHMIAAVLSSEPARHGAADGRADAAEAVDPRNAGPYWTRIRTYFEAARSDA